jgi:hypothetical protein
MNSNRKGSTSRMVVLGALLLLAATASGCGVGLPTQPDVDGTSQVHERSATAAGADDAPFEVGDGTLSGSTADDVVPGEIVVQTATDRNGNAWAKGQLSDKWKRRHGG